MQAMYPTIMTERCKSFIFIKRLLFFLVDDIHWILGAMVSIEILLNLEDYFEQIDIMYFSEIGRASCRERV